MVLMPLRYLPPDIRVSGRAVTRLPSMTGPNPIPGPRENPDSGLLMSCAFAAANSGSERLRRQDTVVQFVYPTKLSYKAVILGPLSTCGTYPAEVKIACCYLLGPLSK